LSSDANSGLKIAGRVVAAVGYRKSSLSENAGEHNAAQEVTDKAMEDCLLDILVLGGV
jgi:hypothetical protein